MIALVLATALAADDVVIHGNGVLESDALELIAPGDVQLVPLTELSLPSSLPFWVARGGELELCRGAAEEPGAIAGLVQEGISHMDYGEEAEAREAFHTAEARLTCAAEPVESELLWDLYFSAGVLAAGAAEPGEAVRLFRAAGLAKPSGTWDDAYAPDIKDLYLAGREAAARAEQSSIEVLDPAGSLDEIWLDGVQLDVTRTNIVSADKHLFQVKDKTGTLISFQLTHDGDTSVSLVSHSALEGLFLEPGEHAEVSELLFAGTAEQLEIESFQVVDVGNRSIYRFDGQIKPRNFVWPEKEEAPAIVVTEAPEPTGEAEVETPIGGRVSVSLLGGMLVYPAYDVGKVMGGPTPILVVHANREIGIEIGLHTGFATTDVGGVFLPMTRLGARYYPLDGDTRPYAGATFLMALHEQHGVRPGAGIVGGLQQRLTGPVHFDADLMVGYSQSITVGAMVGVGFGWP